MNEKKIESLDKKLLLEAKRFVVNTFIEEMTKGIFEEELKLERE